jgi:uncharacterized Zn finger protein
MARYRFWENYRYTPIHEKQAKARHSQSRLARSHGSLQPVAAQGRALATSWWGQAWNENLERYSDYANRLPRGRSYLRNGMVLHLGLEAGTVSALVQGSRPSPYEVTVRVAALQPAVWAKARAACSGQLDSLQALLGGRFPDSLKELFMVQGRGLFPAPSEIEFDCSCPDWASMCKHVAAVLYGIGARLDTDPKLFFTLRQVSVDDLVAKVLKGTSEALLDKASQAAGRALSTADLSGVFGIDLDQAPTPAAPVADLAQAVPAKAPAKRGRAKGASSALPARPAPSADSATPSALGAKGRTLARAESKPAPTPRRGGAHTEAARQRLQVERRQASLARAVAAQREAAEDGVAGTAAPRAKAPRRPSPTAPTAPGHLPPMLVTLLAALRGQRSGLAIPGIMQATGFTEIQARNTVARAQARGLVVSPRRGVYALS